jgi:hypothetical protein
LNLDSYLDPLPFSHLHDEVLVEVHKVVGWDGVPILGKLGEFFKNNHL